MTGENTFIIEHLSEPVIYWRNLRCSCFILRCVLLGSVRYSASRTLDSWRDTSVN